MVVDSSALVAIAFGEPERDLFSQAILSAASPVMSAANWAEAAIVVDRTLPDDGTNRFDRLVQALSIRIVPVSASQARLARAAYRDFGFHSPVRALNYGDCFAYALAKETGQPLLYKGDAFPKTDIRTALS